MAVKAIIFDLDGTIIDSEHIWKHATNQLIINKGGNVDEQTLKELNILLCGLAMHKSCAAIKDVLKLPDTVASLMAEKTAIASSLYTREIKFINGFIRFHQTVVSGQFKTGIATNADDTTLEISKKSLKLEQYFGDHIYNISHVNNVCKPDPALYLHTAQKLDVRPYECVAIEDSAHGIAAAQAAGMFCIGITTSSNQNQTEKADLIIDAYHEIDIATIAAQIAG